MKDFFNKIKAQTTILRSQCFFGCHHSSLIFYAAPYYHIVKLLCAYLNTATSNVSFSVCISSKASPCWAVQDSLRAAAIAVAYFFFPSLSLSFCLYLFTSASHLHLHLHLFLLLFFFIRLFWSPLHHNLSLLCFIGEAHHTRIPLD